MRRTLLVLFSLALAGFLIFLPTPEGLSPQGHALLAVTAGMLVLWVFQAVDFSASAFYLFGLVALFCGLSEDPAAPGQALGAVKGVRLAMQGFAAPAWILVASALFIAAAVDSSGLGRRLSLRLLAAAGTEPRRIVLASLLLPLLLSLIIPSPAANTGLCTVLLLSVISMLGIAKHTNLAKSMFLAAAFGPSFSAIMVLTAGGGPVQIVSFIHQGTGHDISWLEFALYGAPLALGLSAIFYVLVGRLFPLDKEAIPQAKELLRKAMDACGPLGRQEKAISAILALTIPLWATAKVLHPVDTATIAIFAVAAIFCPGVLGRDYAPSWRELCDKVSWGTLMLFGSVLSLGQGLLDSGGAAWFARETLVRMGLADLPLLGMIMLGGAIFAVFGLAFSARAAAIGALTPTIIGFALSLPAERQVPAWGLTLVMNYAVQFTILFPANSPMIMLTISTETFTAREMMRLGLFVSLGGFLLLLILSCTWWPWLGVL